MLQVLDLEVKYGKVPVINGISLKCRRGTIVSIVGANVAGKTTILNAISGIVKYTKGKILFEDKCLPKLPHKIAELGVIQVPEGRKIFSSLTVEENLMMGGFLIKDNKTLYGNIKKIYTLFPVLKERKKQFGATLSGGEQQMLAIGRALMGNVKMILLDEPSLGLAPLLVKQLFEVIIEINKQGITVLLVEQNAKKALTISDYAYVIETGKIIIEGKGKDLINNSDVKRAFLGTSNRDKRDISEYEVRI